MSGDLDMDSSRLKNIPDLNNDKDTVSKIICALAKALIWEYYARHTECIYKIDKG